MSSWEPARDACLCPLAHAVHPFQSAAPLGYGDIVPMGHYGRLFTIFFILVGVGFVGTALGVMVGAALDREELIMDEMVTSKKAFNKSSQHVSVTHMTSDELLETGMDWEEKQYSRLKQVSTEVNYSRSPLRALTRAPPPHSFFS